MRIDVDMGRCQGNGLCESAAPELLSLSSDGTLIVTAADVPLQWHAAARSAAEVCPTGAITVHGDD